MSQTVELFKHVPGFEDPVIVEVEDTIRVRELIEIEDAEGHIWLEDVDEEIDLDLTLVEAGIGHHRHIHRGRCTTVAVTVRFNGEKFRRDFAPSGTIKRVRTWAVGPEAANLSKEQAVEHVLAVPGADHFLDDAVHIGSLVDGQCEVVLDLLPRDRFAG
jgi:hypothetical protein